MPKNSLIKGHIDIDFLTNEMLDQTVFKETHHLEFNW